jgi:hypothetical protein
MFVTLGSVGNLHHIRKSPKEKMPFPSLQRLADDTSTCITSVTRSPPSIGLQQTHELLIELLMNQQPPLIIFFILL